MFLQDKRTGVLVKLQDTIDLIDPAKHTVSARVQSGEEEGDPEAIAKDTLIFPSGESLPQCWIDADYREPNAPEKAV